MLTKPYVHIAALIALFLGLQIQPATAHAQVQRTEPATGQRLAAGSPPSVLKVFFDESVSSQPDALRLFDGTGKRVGIGKTKATGLSIEAKVEVLKDGSYLAVWSVVSKDGHLIRGTFGFTVGESVAGSLSAAELADVGEVQLLSGQAPEGLRFALGVLRWLLFSLLLLLFGTSIVAAVQLPLSASQWMKPVASVAVATAISLLLLEGPYLSGRPIRDLFAASLLGESLGRTTTRAMLGAAALGVLAAGALGRLNRSVKANNRENNKENDLRRWELIGAAVVGGLLLAATGHAVAGPYVPVAFAATALHLVAGATWLSGLWHLAVSRLWVDSAHLRRWSWVAQNSVLALVASGIFNTWRQVGSRVGLFETRYGKVLIAKLALVAVMLLLGAAHRASLRKTQTSRRGGVIAEAVLGVAVLSFSAMLSATIPARVEVGKPASLRVSSETLRVDLTITPARAGKNTIHMYAFEAAGMTADIVDAVFTLTHLESGATVDVDPFRAGRGHEQASQVQLLFAGTWEIRTKVYVTDFEVETFTTNFTVR